MATAQEHVVHQLTSIVFVKSNDFFFSDLAVLFEGGVEGCRRCLLA